MINSSLDVMIIPGADVRDGTQGVKDELTELWCATYPDPNEGGASEMLVKPEDYEQDTFCIVCDDSTENHEILGAGRLRPVTINHKKKGYDLQVVTDIAVKKKAHNKGINRLIAAKLAGHSKSQGIAAVGCCSSSDSAFYQKCGFEIFEGAVRRFKYAESDSANSFDDVLCIRGSGTFADDILDTDEEVILNRPLW